MVDVFECSLVCIMPSRVGQIRGDLGECCDFFGDGFLLIGFGSNEEFLQAFGALSGGLDAADLFLQLPRGHPLVLSLAQRAPSSLTLRGLRANLWFTISVLLALRQSPSTTFRANRADSPSTHCRAPSVLCPCPLSTVICSLRCLPHVCERCS
jgi:hypothetical protein